MRRFVLVICSVGGLALAGALGLAHASIGRAGGIGADPVTGRAASAWGGAEPYYENRQSPVDLLASYYNAIDRGEYDRAYGYWERPEQSLEDFAAGFADTAAVQLIVQPPAFIGAGAGNLYVSIPTVLIARHHDGGSTLYAGCFITHKSNLHPPDIPTEDVWHLARATIAAQPDNASIPALLSSACAGA